MQTLTITSGSDVKVLPKEIPDHRLEILARATIRAVRRYFALPGVQEDYEKWLAEYKKRQETQGENPEEEKKDA